MYNIQFATLEKKLFLIEHQLEDLSFIQIFKNLIDINISENSYKTNVKGKMTKWDTFTNDENFKKIILNYTDILKTFTKGTIYCDEAWGNKLEDKDEILMHDHNVINNVFSNVISGIIYLTENGSGTYFKQFNKTIKEKIGKIVFFSSEAEHCVFKSSLNKIRYTLSFNIKKLHEYK